MNHQAQLRSIQNGNGGGLSTAVTGKATSVRHELARCQGKSTAGEAAKAIGKALGRKIYAKEVTAAYIAWFGRDPEWHHSGFYKNSSGKSTMGRTWFFTDDHVQALADNWDGIAAKAAERAAEKQAEEDRRRVNTVQGFYYTWESDHGGNYGKKRNYKVLRTYQGPELNIPRNFTATDIETFNRAKQDEGRTYLGWNEPTINDFN